MTELANVIAGEKNRTDSLQRSTVDKSFTQNQIIISSVEIEVIDMPTVYEEADITGDFILDHPTYGILDTSELSDDTALTYVVSKINSPNNKFNWFGTDKEEELLKDSSTTATINNTAQTISFTAGQILVIKCYKDTSNVVSAYFNLSTDIFDTIGNYTLELSADNGSHWEATTNTVSHTFTNAGNELLARITCSTTGIITLKNNSSGILKPIQIIYDK